MFGFVCNSILVTIGPPEDIQVTPGEGSLTISFSPPFDIEPSVASFSYYVHDRENAGGQQVRAFFFSYDFLVLEFLMQQKKVDVKVDEENRPP